MKWKLMAIFLVLCILFSMLPTAVFAASECPGAGKHTKSNCDCTVIEVTEPTCGEAGFTTYQCKECKEVFADDMKPATGEHSFVAGEGKAPTCVEPGYEAGQECEVCGLVKPGKEIPALNKDTTSCEWELISGYDCNDKDGKLVFKCTFCDAVQEVKRSDNARDHVIDWSEYVAISATEVAFFCVGAGISGCSYYVIADIKNAHDCADYIYYVDQVDPTCTTDGMKAYEQCRVCNTKYGYVNSLNKYTYLTDKNIEEEYVIKASHSYVKDGQPYEASCADTLLYCNVCKNYVNPGIEHDVDWEHPDGEFQPATCLKPGYMYDTCANCQVKELKILEALGHKAVTVSVPATCGTYAYTFTYCTRDYCDAPVLSDLEVSPSTGLATTVYDEYGFAYDVRVPALAPTTNLSNGFILGMNQENLGKTLFFNGKMDGNYLATTTDASEAVTMYVEKLENLRDGCFVYFTNEAGEKVYINLTEYKSGVRYKASVSLTTETPKMYFTWDADRGIWIAHGNYDTYFLGSYSKYNTISASASYYLAQNGQFLARPYGSGAKVGVRLVNFSFDYRGGYNAEEHVYDVEPGSIVLPTCTKAGSYDMVCGYCFDTVTVELEAGCVNNLIWASEFGMNTTCVLATAADLTAAGIKNTAPAAADTCTEGAYQYCKCTECENVFKMVLSAPLGHHMSIFHDDTDALSHTKLTGYIGLDCAYCDYAIKYETISWKNVNKLYDTEEKAAEDHFIWVDSGNVDEDGETIYVKESALTYVQLSKYGSCTVTGIELWFCSECGRNVRVRQWQEIDGVAYPTGEHAGHRDNHVDSTCAADGSHITYQCARCDAIIGNKALGETEILKTLDHTYIEINLLDDATLAALGLEEYEAAPCDTPNYDNVKYICTGCGLTKTDGTELHRKEVLTDCKGSTIEVYTCHCGEVHIRAMGSYDHKWNGVPAVAVGDKRADGSKVVAGDADITYQAPTCCQTGWQLVQCEYCGIVSQRTLFSNKHTNIAGEKFTDSCLDEVTDRHCVVCCEFLNHDSLGAAHNCTKQNTQGGYDCECMIANAHQWTDATCTEPKTCTTCGLTEGDSLGHQWSNATYPDPKICAVCCAKTYCPGTGLHQKNNCNHTLVSVVHPTCGVSGYSQYQCDDCYELFEADIVAATGAHTFVDGFCAACGHEEEGVVIAEGLCGAYVTWSLNKNGLLTIKGIGLMSDFNGNSSDPWWEYRNQIHIVVIEEGVTGIGDYAFFMCRQLQSITMPDGLETIGNSAFYECNSLQTIVIPNTVTQIDDAAFMGCTALESIVIPYGVTKIGVCVFAQCSRLESVVIPCGVKSIGLSAFTQCTGLQHVYYQGTEAQWNKIVKEEFNEPLLEADRQYCYGIVDSGSWGDNLCWTLDAEGCLIISGVGAMKDFAGNDDHPLWNHMTQINMVVIEPGITNIGDFAFFGFGKLKWVVIPDGVCSVGAYAFYGCGFERITLPQSVTTIGKYAFGECRNLVRIELPEKLTSLAEGAFLSCSNLQSIAIPSGVSSIGAYAFSDCTSLARIVYDGTRAQWNAIDKGTALDQGAGEYVLSYHTCSPGEHMWGNTPCTEPRTCFVCGELLAAAWDHDWEITVSKAPGFAKVGALELVCRNCSEKVKVELPALNDVDYSCEAVMEATATSDGYDRYTWNNTEYGIFSFNQIVRHTAAEDALQVEMESTTVVAGNTVRLEMMLKNNDGMWGLSVRLDYDDSALTLVSVENGNLLSTLDYGEQTKRLIWSADGETAEDGLLCILEFAVAEGAIVGDYPINIIFEESYNESYELLNPHMVSSVVTVINVVYGDVNDDGIINLLDVLMLRKYLVNIDYVTGESTLEVGAGADVNGDGVVNLLDVLMLRKYLVNIDYVTGESTVVLGPQ